MTVNAYQHVNMAIMTMTANTYNGVGTPQIFVVNYKDNWT